MPSEKFLNCKKEVDQLIKQHGLQTVLVSIHKVFYDAVEEENKLNHVTEWITDLSNMFKTFLLLYSRRYDVWSDNFDEDANPIEIKDE